MIETPVLIAGGGPVGLTLGIDLAHRGQPSLIVEERTGPSAHPKATLLGARSMEMFRRWGLDDAIFAAAVPNDHPYYIIFTTKLAGQELHRFRSPSINEGRYRDPEALKRHRELNWSPYSKTQIGQQALEPVLLDHARTLPQLDMRHGWRFEDFEQFDDHVIATIREVETGREEKVKARYLAACDGGGGDIRRKLGIGRNGRGRMRANVSFFFRSRDFLDVHGLGVANLYFLFTPDSFGVFTAIDGVELWNYQYYFLDPAKATEELDVEKILFRAMGKPFKFELLQTMHWHHHQSVARSWRSGQTFLVGDAAHLFAPTGGVGMNTGIGDACDLAWKFDAMLRGWGGDNLLNSYEIERKPVAIRNSLISATNSDKIDMVMDEAPAGIEGEGAEAEAARTLLARKIKWLARQFNSSGVHLGHRYVDSPVILGDGTPEPFDDPSRVDQSSWPGMRAPHAWLPDGRSTLDLVGGDFVLLRFGPAAAGDDALIAAASAVGMPMTIADVDDAAAAKLYERRLVLVRPDGHVAWRGDALPDDAAALIDTVRGFA
ncbi:FAD-dependent monooxygenase [Sphingomonas crocodyli]|uniref:FAD-monooxygenase n=1 Tax=Sphingomonas crocodyli TaxID=1979270 RepID=A0A437LZX0_9SPHN|nr:FAD-dependent monooxygenase [Sphingomonas crocodyli]RVT90978.1 FAD-monooxygenase [Sphingomonas crocodyli]